MCRKLFVITLAQYYPTRGVEKIPANFFIISVAVKKQIQYSTWSPAQLNPRFPSDTCLYLEFWLIFLCGCVFCKLSKALQKTRATCTNQSQRGNRLFDQSSFMAYVAFPALTTGCTFCVWILIESMHWTSEYERQQSGICIYLVIGIQKQRIITGNCLIYNW